MSFKNTLRLAALATLVGAMASATAATTASSTMSVTLTVVASCAAGAAGPLTFNSGGTAANSTINVTCSKGTLYAVALTPSSASPTGAGIMKSATATNSDTVAYQLNQDLAGSKPWGNVPGAYVGTAYVGGNVVPGAGTGVSQALPVYGSVGSYNVRPDSYSDTVAVTVSF